MASYFHPQVSPRRPQLKQYKTIDDAVTLIKQSKNIVVLSGAGVSWRDIVGVKKPQVYLANMHLLQISVSCGIPDFRSKDGIYAQLAKRPELELDDPQQMFDLGYFVEHPETFYSFARTVPVKFHTVTGTSIH